MLLSVTIAGILQLFTFSWILIKKIHIIIYMFLGLSECIHVYKLTVYIALLYFNKLHSLVSSFQLTNSRPFGLLRKNILLSQGAVMSPLQLGALQRKEAALQSTKVRAIDISVTTLLSQLNKKIHKHTLGF